MRRLSNLMATTGVSWRPVWQDDAVASRKPEARVIGIQVSVGHERSGGARGWAPRSKVSTMTMGLPQQGQG